MKLKRNKLIEGINTIPLYLYREVFRNIFWADKKEKLMD